MFSRILRKVLLLYSFKLPSFLVLIGIWWLIFEGSYGFLMKHDIAYIFTIYLTVIAILAGLASVIFGYTKLLKSSSSQENNILESGELFLYSAILIIMALIVSWLAYRLRFFLEMKEISQVIHYVIVFIFFLGQGFLNFAASALHEALVNLEKYFRFRFRNKNL